MQVLQILPTLNYGDAIGNDTLAIHQILKENGFPSPIYAANIGKRIPEGAALPLSQLPSLAWDDVVLYHAAIGTRLNYEVASMSCKKVMIYHNITPPDFFRGYSPSMELQTRSGYIGIKTMSRAMDYCIADSEYNKSELRRMGYTCPIDVCPIIIPFEDYDQTPNQEVLDKYQNDGWTNLLFVGRIAPNKKQEDIIRAFYVYQQKYNPKSRLFLVGNSAGMEKYQQRLDAYIEKLGLEEKVIFPGHIGFDEILTYYQLAHLFVCMSEHEGFCVPLLEAMHFKKPILAYASSAVPETLGAGGLLTETKDPRENAALMNYILTHANFRQSLLQNQQQVLHRFQYAQVRARFEECLQNALSSR
ncbi:MAG: glycosyltransferase [Clostridia bacterium]|nr:glycosyltransferase [Clostridia bacterium]